MYLIKNSQGKAIARTGDRKYAEYYAQHIGGTYSIHKNPAATFGRQHGTASDRKNLFAQYKSTPSFVWARETIQNAVDNKATNIVFSTTKIQSGRYAGCVLARIVDNGTGMSLNILQEKFLTIGGTGKGARGEETGTVGGFGEAKKVVLLAWQAWRVITKTETSDKAILAEANEGWENYNYEYIDPPAAISRRGTIVEVISWPESQYQLSTSDAKSFISYCDLPSVYFTVMDLLAESGSLTRGEFAYNPNKEDALNRIASSSVTTKSGDESFAYLSGFRNKVGNFDLGNAKEEFTAPVEDDKGNIADRKCAKIYYKRFTKDQKAYSTPRIFYRVKGLYLWSTWTSKEVAGNVIVDFTIKTTLILSDNRDSIRNENLREQIEAWITDLIKDPARKIRGFSKTRTMVFEGSADSLQAPVKPAAIATAQRIADLQASSTGGRPKEKEIEKLAVEAAEKVVQIENAMPTQSPIRAAPEVIKEIIRYEATNTKDQTLLRKAIERAMFVPEYVLHIEDDLAEEGFKIPEKFKPENLTKELKKVLAVWAEMIRLAFMMKGSEMTYAVGFVFSEEVLGLHAPKGFFGEREYGKSGLTADGAILINPFYFDKSNRRDIVDVSNPEHIEALWATCIHECTHMIDRAGYHDEYFASVLTTNIGYVARVYPLVELIAEIVQTAEPLARAKFAKGLDVEEYLSRDRKRGRKPKTAREKNLERFAAELASQLAAKGARLPEPEDYDVDLPASMWSGIKEASRVQREGGEATGALSDLLVRQLRNKLKLAEEKIAALESTKGEIIEAEFEEKPILALPAPTRRPDKTKLFKKFNG